MDSYPSHRRNVAIHLMVVKDSTKKALKKLFWDVPEGDDVLTGETFPGILCHNHLYPTTSPRKSNWLEECDYRFGGGSDEDCMSLQEASWGTETLRLLEEIHTSTDPNRIFQVVDGPGYAADVPGASNAGYVAAGPLAVLAAFAAAAAQ